MTPREIQAERDKLTAEYMFQSGKLADVLSIKAVQWLIIRDGVKTDKKADQLWNASEEGLKEMRLKLWLKAAEKRLSSLRTHMELLNAEARNQY